MGSNVLDKVMPKVQGLEQEEDTAAKLEAAHAKIKQKAAARESRHKKGNAIWTPTLKQKVWVRTQPMSDAIKGMTSKFVRL